MLTRLVESCSRRCAPNPSVSPTALYIRPNERRRWSLPFISGRTLDTHFGTGLSFDRWRRLSYIIPFLSTVLFVSDGCALQGQGPDAIFAFASSPCRTLLQVASIMPTFPVNPTPSSCTTHQSIFSAAVNVYKKQTKIDFFDYPLVQACNRATECEAETR